MPKYMLGSDPEVFLRNAEGKLISSIGKVGGSKTNPMKTTHGSVQEDNVLLEFNSIPSVTRDEFIVNHMNILADLEDIVKPLDLSVSIQATGVFDDDQLNHPKAKLAGCERDLNAWERCYNDPPDLSGTSLRSGAGHIHISADYLGDSFDKREDLVKALDLTAGIPSVIMDPDTKRRSLYGRAGCFRYKMKSKGDSFDGIEYRTLSNFWLKGQGLLSWAYDAVAMGIERVDEIKNLLQQDQTLPLRIQRAINNSDTDIAYELINEYDLIMEESYVV